MTRHTKLRKVDLNSGGLLFLLSYHTGNMVDALFYNTPLRNELQATERYINRTHWYLFHRGFVKRGTDHDIAVSYHHSSLNFVQYNESYMIEPFQCCFMIVDIMYMAISNLLNWR